MNTFTLLSSTKNIAVLLKFLSQSKTCIYHNTPKKDIEYNGEATSVTVYWDVNEFLSKGTYRVSVFADGHNIGNASFNYEK